MQCWHRPGYEATSGAKATLATGSVIGIVVGLVTSTALVLALIGGLAGHPTVAHAAKCSMLCKQYWCAIALTLKSSGYHVRTLVSIAAFLLMKRRRWYMKHHGAQMVFSLSTCVARFRTAGCVVTGVQSINHDGMATDMQKCCRS